eukprot:jgi/Mesvir1/27391/Mv07194-RA.2
MSAVNSLHRGRKRFVAEDSSTVRPEAHLIEYADFTARRDRSWNDMGVLIPHTLHRTFAKRNVTQRFREVLDKAGEVDPTLEFTFADDAAAEGFVASHCGEKVAWAFRMLVPGAYKADVYRLCVLYAEGGYYADIGTQLKAPVNSFVPAKAKFVVPMDPGIPPGRGLWNGFLGSTPKHPILARTMNAIVEHVENCWYKDKDSFDGALGVTGPELLARVFFSLYGVLPIAPMWNATTGVLLLPAEKAENKTIYIYDLEKEREVLQDKFPGQTEEFKQMGYMVRGAEHYSSMWPHKQVYSPALHCPGLPIVHVHQLAPFLQMLGIKRRLEPRP